MNGLKYFLLMLLLAACSERVAQPEAEPSILPQCDAYCEKIADVCGFDNPPGWEAIDLTVEECPLHCTERATEKDCGDKKIAELECLAAQSCEDLRWEYEEGQLPPDNEDKCKDERDAFSVCDIVHHSPSGGS